MLTAIGVTVGEDETELEDRLKAGGYKMYDLPKTPAIHTTFPETSLISTVVGKLRVAILPSSSAENTRACLGLT